MTAPHRQANAQVAGTAGKGICSLSMVRTDRHTLEQFIAYNQQLGIDHQYIFIDAPEEMDPAELPPYAGVTFIACDDHFWSAYPAKRRKFAQRRQNVCTSVALEKARSAGYRWIIHMDVDELIYPLSGRPLPECLESSDADLVIFAIHEAVLTNDRNTEPFGPVWFKRRRSPGRTRLARLMVAGRGFFKGEYFRGHVVSKSASRITPQLKEVRIHRGVFRPRARRQFSQEVALLHFDCVSYEGWEEKWRYRTNDNVFGRRSVRDEQGHRYLEAAAGGETAMRAAFSEIHVIPLPALWLLYLAGMVRRIVIPPTAFVPRLADHSAASASIPG